MKNLLTTATEVVANTTIGQKLIAIGGGFVLTSAAAFGIAKLVKKHNAEPTEEAPAEEPTENEEE